MKKLLLLCTLLAIALNLNAIEIASPDGKIVADFGVEESSDNHAWLFYSLSYKNQEIINPSPITMDFQNAASLGNDVRLTNVEYDHIENTWKPVYGERNTIRDLYNSCTLTLEEIPKPHRRFILHVRVYNEGLAFCYEFPEQDAIKDAIITDEKTTYFFSEDYTAWATYSAQGEYEEVSISKIKKGCERPLTIKVHDDLYIALAEARLVDYARTKFDPTGKTKPSLVTSIASDVRFTAPYTTPWRVVMVADSPTELLENNYLILNLNDPCAIEDPSWIRPGKVIREVSLTTEGGKACVDFAVKHNLQFVEYDAGWYGHEYDDASDATTITVDPKRSPGPLDLHEVIRYANERNIGIIVYVNRRALEKQLDEILPLYQSWGIKGVKYGFVNVGSQKWTTWLHEAVKKAAEHKLMVDIHDEYRPTGFSRTYPNLMTQEGIRGDEARPTNDLTLTILFTRMLAGAGDNTICYYDDRVVKNASHAYQLAKAVCFYSPWQFLFWYDRPAEIENEINPELEFFANIPTTWDETRGLVGEVGKYAIIARRSGNEWFVGCMNANEERKFELDFSFLDSDKKYQAKIYSHDESVKTRSKVKIVTEQVSSETRMKTSLPSNGGMAIHLMPK